jgi:Zn-finger nucleic acid-binding protein
VALAPNMTCPDCGRSLSREQHHGVRIDICRDCHGMWFDHGELETYWRASRTASEPFPVDLSRFETEAEGRTLDCPRCASSTLTVRRVDVFVGGPCSSCAGVWLGPSQSGGAPPTRFADLGDSLLGDALEVALELVFDVLGDL